MRVPIGMLLCLTAVGALPASASQPPSPLSETLIGPALVEEMRAVVGAQIVVMSLRAANIDRTDMRQAEIDAFDERWREERGKKAKPLITSTLSSPLSNYVTRIQAHSEGLITEIIIVGRKGLNVGQSSITGDMWQGDEAKFKRTFGVGPGASFIDAAEYHEASGTWRAQLNMTVDDPEDGTALGAATVEINLTELNRRLER